MKSFFQHQSDKEQCILGGSIYRSQQILKIYSSTRNQNGGVMALPFLQSSDYFSSFRQGENVTNRRVFSPRIDASYIRRRVLPVIKATGQTITQAEIDDALDD